jgi:hypothetical protein
MPRGDVVFVFEQLEDPRLAAEAKEGPLACCFKERGCKHVVPDSQVSLSLVADGEGGSGWRPRLLPGATEFYLCCSCKRWNCGRHGDVGLCGLCGGRSCCRAVPTCSKCDKDFGAACCHASLTCQKCAYVSCTSCAQVAKCEGCGKVVVCEEHRAALNKCDKCPAGANTKCEKYCGFTTNPCDDCGKTFCALPRKKNLRAPPPLLSAHTSRAPLHAYTPTSSSPGDPHKCDCQYDDGDEEEEDEDDWGDSAYPSVVEHMRMVREEQQRREKAKSLAAERAQEEKKRREEFANSPEGKAELKRKEEERRKKEAAEAVAAAEAAKAERSRKDEERKARHEASQAAKFSKAGGGGNGP